MSVNDGKESRSASRTAMNVPASTKQARLIKKRELDRRSQRMARERTKDRIAQLERLVEDFQKHDTSGKVTRLTEQLADLRKERDKLAKILQNIRHLAKEVPSVEESPSIPVAKVEDFPWQPTLNSFLLPNSSNDLMGDSISDSFGMSPTQGDSHSGSYDHNESARTFNSNIPGGNEYLDVQSFDINDSLISSYPATRPFLDAQINNQFDVTDVTCSPIIPPSEEVCDCSMDVGATDCHQTSRNLWRFGNEVLTSAKDPALRDLIACEDEIASESLLIQAIVNNWDSIPAALAVQYPSSRPLRTVDETLFHRCGNVERLALFLLMHRLLQYHIVSTPSRLEKLPSWYTVRPSQSMVAHSYAIDFFAWPGVRERFVFFQHHYCSNLFWDLFCSSLRILWPFEFRDCYSRNVETGMYEVSSKFNTCINNINCWTMGPDIFRVYPELYSDIAAVDHIPQSLSQRRLLQDKAENTPEQLGTDHGI